MNPRRPSKSGIRVQVRCLRLDGVGFEHMFPKFGYLHINESRNAHDFKIPDPPNHEKKRKDDMIDITGLVTSNKMNLLSCYQV